MAYAVRPSDDVAAQVAQLSRAALNYWNVCLSEIAADPLPRFGRYVERVIPIAGLPMRTYLYEITEETSISGETLFAFVAEFFSRIFACVRRKRGRARESAPCAAR